MGQSLTMFKTINLCLLVTSSFSLPAPQNERGFFIDVLGGLVAGDGATTAAPVAPVESTTMATLYGDLVNIFNLIFPPASSTTSAATSSSSTTTTSTTTTTTTTST